jgi:arylsulfatase A-like enzyme
MGSKSRPYEESVRVPLLVRGPGFPPGTSREDLVALHDLTATMVSHAGATPGRTLDGNDLTSSDRRGSILLECLACGEDADPLGGWQMLRTTRQAYISYGDGQSESYDLKLDPWELDGRPDPRTPRLTERLEGVSRCAGGDCP